MSFVQQKLGRRIQEIRKSKNLTQEKLAEKIDIDIPNLSNIERGKRFVSANTLEKITKALGVEEKELFDFKHIKSREEIIDSINEFIKNSNDKELEFYYRMIKLYKEM